MECVLFKFYGMCLKCVWFKVDGIDLEHFVCLKCVSFIVRDRIE